MWVNILCFGRAFLLRCVPSVFLELSLSTAILRIFYKLAAQWFEGTTIACRPGDRGI